MLGSVICWREATYQLIRDLRIQGVSNLAKGKTDGQPGDPLEMLIFNLTIHHLWDGF